MRFRGGIAHAFNGSFQQAQAFIDLGFKLGFGGAMTFTRALQIRRLAAELELEHRAGNRCAGYFAGVGAPGAQQPRRLPGIGDALAALRGIPAIQSRGHDRERDSVLPRLGLL